VEIRKKKLTKKKKQVSLIQSKEKLWKKQKEDTRMKGKMMTRLGAVAIAVFAAVALVACGSGYSKPDTLAKEVVKSTYSFSSIASYGKATKTMYLDNLTKEEQKKVKTEYNKIAKVAKEQLKKLKKGDMAVEKMPTLAYMTGNTAGEKYSKDDVKTILKMGKSLKVSTATKSGDTIVAYSPESSSRPAVDWDIVTALETYVVSYTMKEPKMTEPTDGTAPKLTGEFEVAKIGQYPVTVYKIGKKWYTQILPASSDVNDEGKSVTMTDKSAKLQALALNSTTKMFYDASLSAEELAELYA
jgi:hypothetical protein